MGLAGRIAAIGGGVVVVVAGGAFAIVRPDRAIQTATGAAAHHICAAVFTQLVDPKDTLRELVKPLVGGPGRFLSYSIGRTGKSVTARFAGRVPARAVWSDAYGCRLIGNPKVQSPEPVAPRPPSAPDGSAPATVVAPTDPALKAAFDAGLADPSGVQPHT